MCHSLLSVYDEVSQLSLNARKVLDVLEIVFKLVDQLLLYEVEIRVNVPSVKHFHYVLLLTRRELVSLPVLNDHLNDSLVFCALADGVDLDFFSLLHGGIVRIDRCDTASGKRLSDPLTLRTIDLRAVKL